MARDETDDTLPDKDVAKEFYARYEPKEILGRLVPCSHQFDVTFIFFYAEESALP